MKVSTPVPDDVIHEAFEELASRGYIEWREDGGYDLTADGRDWMLSAIWTRLGCPGFDREWWER